MKIDLEKLNSLTEPFHKRPIRERAMALIVAILAPIIAIEYVFLAATRSDIDSFNQSINQLEADIDTINRDKEAFDFKIQQDPDKQSKVLITELENKTDLLDQQLKNAEINLIQPTEMVQVLRKILLKNSALTLTKMHNQTPTEMHIFQATSACDDAKSDSADACNNTVPTIYEHRLVLNFTGSYQDTLSFVSEVEGLEWQIFWDNLSISMKKYPNALISITLKTLSLQQKWIGV